jgi:nucleoside phosphorylase
MADKRTLVVAAMRSELAPFTKATRGRTDCVGAVIGIGTERAEASTRRLLDEHDVDRVLMIGIAGGVGPSINIGDLVVPEVVLNGTTDAEYTPHPVDGAAPRGWLHTSDEFVQDVPRLTALAGRGVIALDMETAAVGMVCEERGVPWSVLRGISDHVEGLPVDPAVLDLMGPEGEPRLANVAKYVARNPMRMRHLAKLQAGAKAATTASVRAALAALGS